MMNGDWSNWHWGLGFGHWIFGILVWVVIILAVVYVFRNIGGGSGRAGTKTALEILKERYARGEIDRDEYERMRHDLDG